MASFVRNHSSTSVGADDAVTANLTAAVTAGNVLLATSVIADHSSGYDLALSKPVGETANWVILVHQDITDGEADQRTSIALYAIKTTVPWSSGYTVTGTVPVNVEGLTLALSEFNGISTEVVTIQSISTNDRSSGPSLTATTNGLPVPGDVVIQAGLAQFSPSVNETATGGTGTGTRQELTSGLVLSRAFKSTAYMITGAGSRSVTYSPGAFRAKAATILALKALDYPPHTPVLTTNAGGITLDRARTIRLGWTFSSPNYADTQSKYDLRYRLAGAGSWTTVTQVTPNTFRDYAGGTFAAGDYEWQVLYYSALNQASDWSASGYFTAGDIPEGPTITYPIDAGTVEQVETATWSVSEQDVYQFRRVADDDGDPDTDTVYYDSGEVTTAIVRELALDFATNNRFEHLQMRVQFEELWSEWDSIRVEVAYTPPPVPSLELYVDESEFPASFLVVVTNPDPEDEEDPAAIYNDVYVDDGSGEERKATGLAVNGQWRYWTPVSGRDYADQVRVVAVAANGTTVSSS